MNILIAGGSGFVGKNLTKSLLKKGHHVYILTRSPEKYENTTEITYMNYDYPAEKLPLIQAVINLAGDTLFGLWTKNKKDAILSSRIETTQALIEYMRHMKRKPDVFISGSAIGYYGTSTHKIFTENTQEHGDDFLADVVTKWEATAKQAEKLGIRTVYTRFGVILGKEGALPLMSIPVKLFAGGKIGKGEHWVSWVHITDVVDLIIFCLNNDEIKGPVNVTSPYPLRNKDFLKTLASVLKRPYWIPTPAPLLRMTIGEMSELITKGQYALPKQAETYQFQFSYPTLENALKNIRQ